MMNQTNRDFSMFNFQTDLEGIDLKTLTIQEESLTYQSLVKILDFLRKHPGTYNLLWLTLEPNETFHALDYETGINVWCDGDALEEDRFLLEIQQHTSIEEAGELTDPSHYLETLEFALSLYRKRLTELAKELKLD